MEHQSDTLKYEIEKLLKKAEVCRQCYSFLERKYSKLNLLTNSLLIIFSSIVAILTFSDSSYFIRLIPKLDNELLTLFTGILASVIFIISVLSLVFNFSGKAQEQLISSKQYTRFIKDYVVFRSKEEISEEEYFRIKDNYNMIGENASLIPDNIFLKCKRMLLIKIKISKSIDKNPMKSIRNIKRELNGK